MAARIIVETNSQILDLYIPIMHCGGCWGQARSGVKRHQILFSKWAKMTFVLHTAATTTVPTGQLVHSSHFPRTQNIFKGGPMPANEKLFTKVARKRSGRHQNTSSFVVVSLKTTGARTQNQENRGTKTKFPLYYHTRQEHGICIYLRMQSPRL